MKAIFIILLFISFGAVAQLSNKQIEELRQNTAKVESSRVQLEAVMKESQRRMDSANMAHFNEQNIRNLNAFMAARKEQERKAMNRMYWRIGFGVLMLIVLIAGWARKKKAAK